MNDAVLDDFDESTSEVWKKRFRNSSECSSVDKWLDMMRFVWKKDWTNDNAWELKKKDVWNDV